MRWCDMARPLAVAAADENRWTRRFSDVATVRGVVGQQLQRAAAEALRHGARDMSIGRTSPPWNGRLARSGHGGEDRAGLDKAKVLIGSLRAPWPPSRW